MKKVIRFEDGEEVVVSPITYKEFVALDVYGGASDMAYKAWLYHNNFVDPNDYEDEALKTSTFRLVEEVNSLEDLEFDPFGVEKWVPYHETIHTVALDGRTSRPEMLKDDLYFR